SIEKNFGEAPELLGKKFTPNCIYTDIVPKDMNFEDFCYRSAVLHEPLHTYVKPERYDFWFNLFFMPIVSDDPRLGYCTYTQIFSKTADTGMMTDISNETSSSVLNTCIKLRGAESFSATMNEVMADILGICGANYCCVMLMNHDERSCSVLAEAVAPGAVNAGRSVWLTKDFYDLAMGWMNVIGGSNCLILKNADDMEFLKEKDPVWYESLVKVNVTSLVLFPLICKGELIGYIWANNFDTDKTLKIKETLELTTFFIASEIYNYQLLKKLQTTSSIDMLTGVYNWYELNRKVEVFDSSSDSSIGVVMVDMNGLKLVNDSEGHKAGDKLIRIAANVLKNSFVDDEIFRSGGDEFIVLIHNAEESDVKTKIEMMNQAASNIDKLSFAVGYCIETDVHLLREAIDTADKRMYEDKEEYYRRHPELKKR
ncbi:MAG: GGDEF domain-containing protein, partial [Clostridiales bacterium]|nr:GGDEF domain-containing protein [Clostridiales bacterium]